jgi:transcriptional/translational regulatory protein YebC/TACO1
VEVAAREGGSGDVKANMTLASAVDKARSFSVPVENIERAIKRGSGDLEAALGTKRSRTRATARAASPCSSRR